MQNFSFDFQHFSGLYAPQTYSWTYPVFYYPISPFYENPQLENSFSYENQKSQNAPQTCVSQKDQKQKIQDEQFMVSKSSEEFLESSELRQKKKRKYYGTKNTEANIINQTFSFMNCSNKSRKILAKIINGDEKKIEVFYIMMKIVKRNMKKYVNRTYLKSIFSMDRTNVLFKLLSKGIKRLQILSISQFKQIFRQLVWYYFNNEMVTHILSSNRLSKNTVSEHLKRRRQIMGYIFETQKNSS